MAHSREVWKEINEHTRHWENLVFESSKNYFTVVSLALGGAGVAVAWSGVDLSLKRLVVSGFLSMATALAVGAFVTLGSQQAYLKGFYDRRKSIEHKHPSLQLHHPTTSGRTTAMMKLGFFLAALLSIYLTVVIWAVDPGITPAQ